MVSYTDLVKRLDILHNYIEGICKIKKSYNSIGKIKTRTKILPITQNESSQPRKFSLTLLTQEKALNGIQWEVAHPLSLNYGAPIASMDAAICVSGGGNPYIGITKGFKEFYKLETFCYTYLWGAFIADIHGCIHESDRGSVI